MAILNYDGTSHLIEKIVNLLKGKSNTDHKHTKSDITDFPTLGTASSKDVASTGNASSGQVVMGNDTRLSDARKASDVYSWAKAKTKPSYTASEVGAAPTSHTHDDRYYIESEVDTKLNGKLSISLKGSVNGLAELDSNGKVPSTQLPSFVDDVIEGYLSNGYFYKESSPNKISGESGKIYIDLFTEKTYRWSGSKFVVISDTITLGETSTTAYRGDKGKVAYDHSQTAHARTDATKVEKSSTNGNIKINGTETTVYTHPSGTNPHGTTKSDVGLGNVDNTADSAKSVKYATSAGSASSASKATGVVDYGSTSKTIQIGYGGDGISGDAIKYIAGYTTGNGSDVNAKIKDISKDALKSWLGLGSLAYSSATIPTIPSSLPANGGTAKTISQKVNASSLSHTNYNTNGTYVPTMNFLSYWNGAYSSSGASNLSYCSKGAFGTAATKNTGDFATANHTHSNYLTGITSAMVTNALGYTPPKSDTNTWRPVQNNLTSTSTTDSLSAAQGKILKDMIDNNSGSGNVNYEPGTWRPAIGYQGESSYYYLYDGKYEKIGDLVFLTCCAGHFKADGEDTVYISESSIPFPMAENGFMFGRMNHGYAGSCFIDYSAPINSFSSTKQGNFSDSIPVPYVISIIYRTK